MKKIKPKLNAKHIFNKYVSKTLIGKNTQETINNFCSFNYNYFYDLAQKYKLQERQISSLVGFKDEYFVEALINQVINENKLENRYYCKKITANENSGLHAREIIVDGEDKILTIGGDCVIFSKADNKPLMIIECKEYIDMIRMKELIGESRIIRDRVSGTINLLEDTKFCVFAEVLELTDGWKHLLKKSDLKHQIDEIFVIRDGKRKDRENKPVNENLQRFRDYIESFLLNFK